MMKSSSGLGNNDFQNEFQDKVGIVTGAASGIGRATALAFAKMGSKVCVADLDEGGGEKTVSFIQELGGDSFFLRTDVSRPADVKRMVEESVKRFGGLNYAFNNAGIEGQPAKVNEVTEDAWDRMMSINLKSVWLCMKEQIPEMLKQGEGAIVNCSSVAGLIGIQSMSPYVATKHAVVGLTKTAAIEYAQTGIRINAVCPGVIQTPMIDRFTGGSSEALAGLEASSAMGRVGRPEEIADAVLWLCSSKSSFVVGQALPVDGGWLAK
jgi:NAD(P)-dependent dehydrogenase (short-subunit alcohol dehydrogenase family)